MIFESPNFTFFLLCMKSPPFVIFISSKFSSVSLEPSSSVKKKKKVKSMFPVSAVADNKSKAASQDECLLLAKILYGTSGRFNCSHI